MYKARKVKKEVSIMRISGNVTGVTGIYTNDKRISRVESLNNVTAARDNIKISSTGKDFSTALNALKKVPDVRQDRVDEISAKINNGEYKVSGEDIMNKLFNEHVDFEA